MEVESSQQTCYRHPNRSTRLACSNCGRPICAECSHDAAVGQKCPECAAPQGRARVIQARQVRRLDRRGTPVTMALLAVNIGVFILGRLDPELGGRFFVEGSMFNPAVAEGEWYRLFTSAFLHANFAHVLFNMYALYLFGPALERRAGSVPFAALYLASALAGSAVYFARGSAVPAVGASGAIFGLFGALLATLYKQRHTAAGRALFNQLAILLLINLSLPFVIRNIAWEAHLGGLVAGIVIAAAWERVAVGGPDVARIRTAIPASVAIVAFASTFVL
ncbi:MAG: rhomboid family intramembrane serine protease [Acidimicrobiia bacterium]